MEIGMRLSREEDRSASIDEVEHFDHMLAFAFRISRNRAGVFEIHLHFLQGFTWLLGPTCTLRGIEDVSKFAQDFPDSSGGTWRDDGIGSKLCVAMQIVEDGTWPRCALQVLRWTGTDLDDTLDQAPVGRRRWRMRRARTRKEHLQVIEISLPKAFEPFFDKADGTADSRSELWSRPLAMLEGQAAKRCTLGDPLSFQKRDLLENGGNNQTMTNGPARTSNKRAALLKAYHIVLKKRKTCKRRNG